VLRPSVVWEVSTLMPLRKSFALVFNARAGAARPKLLDGVLAGLKSAGADVFQLPARNAEEASARVAELAASDKADAVIAAGGDGTFRAVATGAANSNLPIGYIPLGTGNVLAYEIGIRKRARDITQNLLENPTLAVQGGLVNGAPFFLMVGAGFDAAIVNGLNYTTKRLLARAAYTAPVTKTLLRGASLFDVSVDGRSFNASWVIITRASHYGGSFVLTRDTQLGANDMIAIIIDAQSRAGLIAASTALSLGRLVTPASRPRGVTVLPANRVVIGQRITAPVQVDGDAEGTSPVEINANGPIIQLIVPPAYVADVMHRHTNRVHSNM
jgi:diacylglycerol kinase (ATP)